MAESSPAMTVPRVSTTATGPIIIFLDNIEHGGKLLAGRARSGYFKTARMLLTTASNIGVSKRFVLVLYRDT